MTESVTRGIQRRLQPSSPSSPFVPLPRSLERASGGIRRGSRMQSWVRQPGTQIPSGASCGAAVGFLTRSRAAPIPTSYSRHIGNAIKV